MASTKKRSPLAPEFSNSLQGVAPEDLNAFNTEAFVQAASSKPQASSSKRQAPKVSSHERQASSPEQQASSDKPRAASSKTSLPS